MEAGRSGRIEVHSAAGTNAAATRKSSEQRGTDDKIVQGEVLLQALSFDQARELAGIVVEAGKHGIQVLHADVLGQNFADDGTKIGG